MKVFVDNGKELKSLLNTGEKCISELSGGCLAVKCVQLICTKDPSNSQGKGTLKVIAYKEGLCSLIGVMEDVVIGREGSVFIDKYSIHELLELLSVVESSNVLITLQKDEKKDFEIKVKGYGSKKLGVVSNDESGEEIRFPISGLNAVGKEWKEVFRDNTGRLIEKLIKLAPHVNKQDEYIEIRVEERVHGTNHHEVSLNMRLLEGNMVRYITHVQMSDDQYDTYVGTSFRVPTKLKDIVSLFKAGFTFSISGEKEQIYKFGNAKGDQVTFFPCTTLTPLSSQVDTCVKDPETLFSMDVGLDRLIGALKFHMAEKTGGDALLSLDKDYLTIKGDNSISPAEIQLQSMKTYDKGWVDLIVNVKPLISGGQSILNLFASAGNVVINVVPYKKNARESLTTHRVLVIEPYAEFEGGSPTVLISSSVKDVPED